ncbi:hypothetical protein ColTof4_09250 [Colletotrichum tofieldiae]|uniref:Uncharacterized protein n=1 Tax=Colletotrichum tofieldiae TaxID=708197 RepID=A0A166XQJ4_9PEZI|nr:hypothetical protein CT0861_07210 [Colletotrichum tofieldiae]GKT56203.1 hypothetical protein ColTof3_03542 [Colletotrichum tofieldiae]GKT76827.1 hypothetical protein ColTof4_09250 [Colletotrichum tofieldiae]GKT97485.1 hypothetical protein Ct61P_15335 [Colletotrichum tofieldiae]
MSGSSCNQRPTSSYPQSVYSGSANTTGRPRDTPAYQTPYNTYASSPSDPMERFWVTGQGTHRTRRAADELARFDQQWSSASRR